MSLNSVFEFDLPSLIGFMLESICYGKHRPTESTTILRRHFAQALIFKRRFIGIYSVIFAAFIRIRLKRKNNGSKALLYLVTINFIACTAYLALDVSSSQMDISFGLTMASNALHTTIDFISQVILVNFFLHTISVSESTTGTDATDFPSLIKIYRCWIMWRKPWVMAVPMLLTLTFLGANLSTT